MKNKPYNALQDFTEADKAKLKWVQLQENKLRTDCEPKTDNSINWTKWLLIVAFGVFVINWVLR